jgi:hypothetical protein
MYPKIRVWDAGLVHYPEYGKSVIRIPNTGGWVEKPRKMRTRLRILNPYKINAKPYHKYVDRRLEEEDPVV